MLCPLRKRGLRRLDPPSGKFDTVLVLAGVVVRMVSFWDEPSTAGVPLMAMAPVLNNKR